VRGSSLGNRDLSAVAGRKSLEIGSLELGGILRQETAI